MSVRGLLGAGFFGSRWARASNRPYVGNVVPGHEDLSDGLFQSAKDLVPEGNQASLADRSEGLFLADRALLAPGKGGEFHAVEAHSDCAGGDDDDAVSEGTKGDAGLGEGGEGRDLRKVRRIRLQDRRRACGGRASVNDSHGNVL